MDSNCPENPESHPARLAQSLGRPLARGYLSHAQAEAAILVYCVRLSREGHLAQDPIEMVRVLQHITRLNANNIVARKETTIGAIRLALRPLLAIGAPANRLRAAAHDQNGAHGFALSEAEVEEVALAEAWLHSQRARTRGGRYG